MKIVLDKILKNLIPFGLSLLFFSACLQGGKSSDGEVIEFNGVGLRQYTAQSSMISGVVKYSQFTGGSILVEARYSVPCTYGRCPVVGEPPIASVELNAPGMYALQLPIQPKDLMIIASMTTPGNKVRVASTWILGDVSVFKNIDLDLGEINPPLR